MTATGDTLSPRSFPTSDALLEHVLGESPGGRVLLSFSAGKDAICSWLALRNAGFDVVPFYLYGVPGLEFVETGLAYFERYFGVRIHRFPAPALYRQLRNLVFQPPERCRFIEAANLPNLTYERLERDIRQSLAMPDAWLALGVRAADSPRRALACKRNGVRHPKRKTFYPIFDWNLDRVIDSIRGAGLRLPVDYKLFGRSFDGIHYQYLKPIREHFPRDYERILQWFPLADLELFRRGEL